MTLHVLQIVLAFQAPIEVQKWEVKGLRLESLEEIQTQFFTFNSCSYGIWSLFLKRHGNMCDGAMREIP